MRFQRFIYPFFALLIAGTVTLLSFQNCQEPPSAQSGQSASGLPDSPDPTDSQGPGSEGSLKALKVEVVATPSVAVDCSSPDASFAFRVRNASLDLMACLGHEIVTPGFSRDGEVDDCAVNQVYAYLKDREEWVYDAAESTWSYSTDLRNHRQYIPGDFYLSVREGSSGSVVTSDILVIRRAGARNCRADE